MSNIPRPNRRRSTMLSRQYSGNEFHLHPKKFSFADAFFATTIYRSWNLIVLATLWATVITVISEQVRNLSIAPTVLTVYGIVIGFTISYRTSSSFERYNEGRRLWSTIILASRTFSRAVWFHVPNSLPASLPNLTADSMKQNNATERSKVTPKDAKKRSLDEKSRVIELIEAFSVGAKHYLREEDGIDYKDLHQLVHTLPQYALPNAFLGDPEGLGEEEREFEEDDTPYGTKRFGSPLPEPATANQTRRSTAKTEFKIQEKSQRRCHGCENPLPANNPPKRTWYDIWPMTLLIRPCVHWMKDRNNKDRLDARGGFGTHNVSLEISFYLSSYISALQWNKYIDVPTTNMLLLSLNQMVEALTGLERIVSNPIPFSYGFHLWVSCALYIILLPFQICGSFGYVTIPATAVAAFFFFGFLVAGEEIENPFGYDKNDLDLEHFCHDIIREELRALTGKKATGPAEWMFNEPSEDISEQESVSGQEKKDTKGEQDKRYDSKDSGDAVADG